MYIGISSYFHESSVALINEKGDLIDFQREDWHSRIKGDRSFPRMALIRIIDHHDINLNDVNFIFYEKPLRSWLTIVKYSIKYKGLFNQLTLNYFKNFWKSSISFYFDLISITQKKFKNIYYSDHHFSHALTSLYYNKHKFPCVALVLDGYGDNKCSTAYLFESYDKFLVIWSSGFPNSIGLFYSAITDYLGFSINEGEYKVMGLSSYGKPSYLSLMQELLYFDEDELIINMKYFDFDNSVYNSYSSELEKYFKIPAYNSASSIQDSIYFEQYADIAASAQALITELVIELSKKLSKKTNINNFTISGGVALNCKMVQALAKEKFIKSLYVPPSPGDSGAAIGAAYFGYLHGQMNSSLTTSNKNNNQLIYPGVFNQETSFLNAIFEKICDKENIYSEAVRLLCNNEIIATCYKNIETGPRSLGNRSLICNAGNAELVKKLSREIKGRESFIPVAPSMLLDTAQRYYNLYDNIQSCYDTMSAITNLKINYNDFKYKSIVHEDCSSRIHICEKESLLGKILSQSSGQLEILANTSFNFSNDPVSYSYEDSVMAMKKLNVSYLLTDEGIFIIK